MVYAFSAGQKLTASALNSATMPGNLVALHVRSSTSTPTTSGVGVGVIYLDIPVVSGRVYWVGLVTPAHHDSTVTTDNVMSKITYTLNGSTPTASSAILDGAQVYSLSVPVPLGTIYQATFTGTLKTLLCIARAMGSGSARLYADAVGRSMVMAAFDLGLPASGGSNA
ncbi:chitobiase/beta-hexosaminidase C-terminal domain-containing protein [Saccharothrix saharensis]|uniref:chitobiase/beta-hexosaminidase C-terminal domain-containing protein n=1 Tax=Saccharothrix saharensis TaxID=571190 RepID=UPI0036A0ED0B